MLGNLAYEEYGKNKQQTRAGEYTFDETNKMVGGVNANGEQSIYTCNGLGALMENTWVIAKNGVLQNETNNSKDMGTYNYFGSEVNVWGYALYDVATFYMWGNTYDDYIEFYTPKK